MENDNKKKKNKKKKNKQAAKNAEPSTAAAAVAASVSVDEIPNGFNQNQKSDAFQEECMAQPTADLDGHGVTASDASTEQVKQLQMEKEACMNKENDSELKLSNICNEKEYWLQKEAFLEEKIKQLQMEKEEYMKKEADLGIIISKLQTEKDSWLRREVFLEEKIKLLETQKESWAQKENSTTEIAAGLNADNARLRSQVMELEESLKNLIQENQQLLENISGLQIQIENSAHLSSEIGEMENQHIKSEMLAAQTMVEKLLLENVELAETLNAEHDRQGTMAELSSSGCTGPVASTIKSSHNVEHSSGISDVTNQNAESLLIIPVAEYLALKPDSIAGTPAKLAGEVVDDASSEYQPQLEEKTTPVENNEVFPEEFGNHSNNNNTSLTPDIEVAVSSEIEQIPLEENEASGTNLLVEDSSSDETSLVPISDAPLIGAPFRFISFMARYVSGADLVNQSS